MGMDSLPTHERQAGMQIGRQAERQEGRQEENWIPKDYRGWAKGI